MKEYININHYLQDVSDVLNIFQIPFTYYVINTLLAKLKTEQHVKTESIWYILASTNFKSFVVWELTINFQTDSCNHSITLYLLVSICIHFKNLVNCNLVIVKLKLRSLLSVQTNIQLRIEAVKKCWLAWPHKSQG
jgi:hypothetical protein